MGSDQTLQPLCGGDKGIMPGRLRTLMAIQALTDQHGHPPTLRDLMIAIGVRSINTVVGHVAALKRRGYIERDADLARTIRPLYRFIPAQSLENSTGHQAAAS